MRPNNLCAKVLPEVRPHVGCWATINALLRPAPTHSHLVFVAPGASGLSRRKRAGVVPRCARKARENADSEE
ncbi:hypothetical protein SRB17_84780 [Streptomyces sp. RB17]|nr:hypothetical protein [Streptomyces sp. RB17]